MHHLPITLEVLCSLFLIALYLGVWAVCYWYYRAIFDAIKDKNPLAATITKIAILLLATILLFTSYGLFACAFIGIYLYRSAAALLFRKVWGTWYLRRAVDASII